MNTARLKRLMTKLEDQVPTLEERIAAMSPEERRQRLTEIIETAKARKAAIDEALASGDPKRVRWARKQLRELKGNAGTEARRAEVDKLIQDIRERLGARQADSTDEPTVGVT
jgi:hypothetical protein